MPKFTGTKDSKPMSMLEYIQKFSTKNKLTLEEFKRIRNEGTEDELIEALEKMADQGGYECLVTEE